MQGKSSSEHGSALNEQLTVVLISHERPAFLRRAVRFYSSLPCKILVLDSSVDPQPGMSGQFPNVDYQHLPQFGYWGIRAKLAHGIEQVTTPFMVFAADDDFLVHDALHEAVAFMGANPDYSMCHGYSMMYLALVNSVSYYRRDKKVCEDYSSEHVQDRVQDYMQQYIPPFYAVQRTALLRDWYHVMPHDTIFQWQEVGHTYYMLARGKVRILPIAYVVREINYVESDHKTEIYHSLAFTDAKSVAEREAFAGFLAGLPTQIRDLDAEQGKQFVLQSFEALADSLRTGRALCAELIFESSWTNAQGGPQRRFGPKQYVEMPFYNQAFFDQLTQFEFLLHAMPAGRVQLQGLEGIWTRQQDLMRPHNNDTPESIVDRLWLAHERNAFNRTVVKRLAAQLALLGQDEEAQAMHDWIARLEAVSLLDHHPTFDKMLSGRLLNWLASREPTPQEAESITQYLAANGGGPQFGIFLLDLDNNIDKLQVTLDSLLEGHSKAFKIVVFTTGEAPAATTAQNTLHFVRVTPSNVVDKLNLSARQSPCDWLLLAEAGDEFTAAGLLRASLELMSAPDCRAVATDEIQRTAEGALVNMFRPGLNLDLLQSLPAMMARHWLIRREVMLEVGGYQADFSKALEFDLLLRIIEQGGLNGLAHLDEPLLITPAPRLEENAHERQALLRHLGNRGYKAQITSTVPGTYQVDYRHVERPLVSIIVPAGDDLPVLQRCLDGMLLRTRYTRYEVLIAANPNQSAAVNDWLGTLQNARVRVLYAEQPLSDVALCNAVSQEAQGEYLVLLAADSEVVNPNWIESLLNHAQRPEVGVVGAKLVDRDGNITHAGLILGMNGGVGSAFVGERHDASVPLHRLSLEQNYSAVSKACLMVRKALFDDIGGLDDVVFAEGLSDVDLCLKASQAGYLTVWTPLVQVIHSGELPPVPQALDALREKWAAAFAQDPSYNANLALNGKGFTLGESAPVNWAQLLA
ncbi:MULTISPECIES: TIGR00180 family glycosyltransferase [unclassified Pseudomonas]|uniref:TIGR00180 family glycosyltransferase n=1 Tax=unclassified Pseudomonas TaxID=196821 RepID=UPI002AC978D3|nr:MULTISPECIES: TIGR00180 family glycosyltransferase [unclassified Pseudomonas]MEB0045458.1 TIGR00180 family glycosyltransferase [Pseudomonas sp. Dout3]MEB0097076.1 TIGR00180 family glycosyltransferase [Pseudomonas sp. DC1.2]WPX60491.1 TIGR00180 family glycosyltransferase [Pseudomonas sp. DC1.2]